MNYALLFWIIVIFTCADKALTYYNLQALNKNNSYEETISAERNPLGRWFFGYFGLEGGTILYGILSFISTISLALLFINFFKWNGIVDMQFNFNIAVYFLFIVYGLVIFNNTYFLIKHNNIL